MDIYLVGGAVRDRQLGLPVRERDWVVVGATPEELLDLGYTPVGKDFPVFLHPETREEYALARTERKTGPGYTGFDTCAAPGITLEEDLLRRDLTINAMAETPAGDLVDPYGGKDDLDKGILRHVSPAFSEDPVRILRIARFAARFARYGFHVAHSTNALMRQMVASGEVDHLVPERVWSELVKALEAETPVRFFDVLAGCGALTRLFPELPMPADTAGTATHGHDGIALPALQQAVTLSDKTTIRFAALVCDMDNRHSPGLDNAQLAAFCVRHRTPNAYRELAEHALRYRNSVHDAANLSATDLLDLLGALDAFRREQRLLDFLCVCEADARSRKPDLQSYSAAALLRQARQAAAGVTVDVPKGVSGKEVGERIRSLRIEAIQNMR
ncbi:MAG: multifunctional CCA addition/repair protein [Gammaproteobacteria bacterium]